MYVADEFTRVFDDETLPDEVKSKITMVLASGSPILHDEEVTLLNLMTRAKDDELIDIGWRVSDSWFCIVLTRDCLMRLRGE